jgi:hypothetical protein
VPAGVVVRSGRDGWQQTRLARLQGSPQIQIESFDDQRARSAGQLRGIKGTSDVIDASVVRCTWQRRHRIATSDRDDIRVLDSKAQIILV